MIKRILIAGIAALSFATGVFANAPSFPLDKAPDRVNDMAALQSGAKLFVNYCLNCHSAAFMRFNRLKDIGLTEQQIKDKLLFPTDKIGDTMKATIDPKQAKDWFGAIPPDLTLVARSRASANGTGADYLYTYMRSFYQDSTTVSGWNNLVFPNIAMPHVLWELQGERQPQFEVVKEHGAEVHKFTGWKQITPGTMTPAQYDNAMGNLVAYMTWMAEPAQNNRKQIGVGVLIFLLMFSLIAWRLNAAYWKDIK